jgi:hypothetical protein
MIRRHLLAGLFALPASHVLLGRATAAPRMPLEGDNPNRSGNSPEPLKLTQSGRITSRGDGQVIENLDINVVSGNAITVQHRRVTVRNCRIRHAGGHGVHAVDAAGLQLRDLEIDHVGAPPSGVGPHQDRNNVNIEGCPGAIITRVKASRGASNIYALNSKDSRLSLLELHDARGPIPRGQNVQFNKSPDSILEDFSAENGPTSWTEDNVSVFRSDGCVVRRGLVSYNNSPSGDGIMLEGSFSCFVEDVDAEQQGNGAFAAVPGGHAGSGGCTFLRCRTHQTYNSPRDGRAAPSSGGLSIYTRISPGADKHTITDCQYDALANPKNLIWELKAVNPGWSFTRRVFTLQPPIRLAFGW